MGYQAEPARHVRRVSAGLLFGLRASPGDCDLILGEQPVLCVDRYFVRVGTSRVPCTDDPEVFVGFDDRQGFAVDVEPEPDDGVAGLVEADRAGLTVVCVYFCH